MWFWLVCVATVAVYSAEGAGAGAARLVCYVESERVSDYNECTHLIYAGNARGNELAVLLKGYRKSNPQLKIILRVTDADEDTAELLKSKNVQGLEIYDAHRSFNKTKVTETVEVAKAAISSAGGGPLFVALPAHPELLAKYYDLRTLAKKSDLLMVQTHALGLVKKMAYHPSRLSGLWDMMNTDSVVDLVVGLGAPASKLVISLPATARQFSLQNETLSTPGSPTTDEEPTEIDQSNLCQQLRNGKWTLERDQDLSGPYAFQNKTWISFEDSSSVDVKAKYARVRGLAGLALHDADRDEETACGPSLRTALAKALNQQKRAPRAAVLRSLENEILAGPVNARSLDALQVSPYRITQVVDSDGVIHSIREDTRTEFSCSRQGYFVHPRSCARFYRCVKFDQLSPDYTVFEFDCPSGLAFDSRYEVCVWPGSLSDSQACPGSSEIAPVPRTRFICPDVEGYYVDPENCRWFFACLDHGKSPLSAYEFRCPFGLGFDPARLTCDWPWLVPACAGIGKYEAEAFGFSRATLGGAAGFQGKTADSINIAAHQSLVSGASLSNLVGIQNSFVGTQGAGSTLRGSVASGIDSGFSDLAIAGQGESSGISYNVASAEGINQGLLQLGGYGNDELYESGSILLDDYRFNDRETEYAGAGSDFVQVNSGKYLANAASRYQAGNTGKYVASDAGQYRASDSGKYRASQTGQYITSNIGKYIKGQDGSYVAGDQGKYRANGSGKYVAFDSGQYKATNTGRYIARNAGKYRPSQTGQYVANDAGKYKGVEAYAGVSPKYDFRYQGNAYYTKDDRGRYVHNPIGDRAKEYEHVSVPALPYSHLDHKYVQSTESYPGYEEGGLIKGSDMSGGYEYPKPAIQFNEEPSRLSSYNNGAIDTGNVGLVGKTNLVDIDNSQNGVVTNGAVNHDGSSYENVNGYFTTPVSSLGPTTGTPIEVTSYKTLYVPEKPKSNIKQVFTYNQPDITVIQPTVVAIKQVPNAFESSYNQASKYSNSYGLPNVKIDLEVPYSTPSTLTSKTISEGFIHNQQTIHGFNDGSYQYQTDRPVTEEPFRKVIAYTTGAPVSTYAQPNPYENGYSYQTTISSTARPTTIVVPSTIYENPFLKYTQTYNNQQAQQRETISNSNVENYQYTPTIKYKQPQIYSTPRPVISIKSTIQPVTFSEQNLHVVDGSRVNIEHGTTISGNEYSRPIENFETVTSVPATSSESYRAYNEQTKTSTPSPLVDITYQQPQVSINVNPILQYTPKYSDASIVSRQEFRQNLNNDKYEQKNRVFVSTTPATLIYEDHYTDYETPINIEQYESKSVKPQIEYKQVSQIQKSSSIVNNYNGIGYQTPEIQVAYKAEEYLPPLVTVTTQLPISISTKAPEYLPPSEYSSTDKLNVKTVQYFPQTQQPTTYASTKAPEYLPPVDNSYIISSTGRSNLKTAEFFPAIQQSIATQENSDSDRYEGEFSKSNKIITLSTNAPTYATTQENKLAGIAKSNLLGFETVGTNAGLVANTYSTVRPVASTTPYPVTYSEPVSVFKGADYLPPRGDMSNTFDYSTVYPKIKYNPFIESVTTIPIRKHNLVVESAKAQLIEAGAEVDSIEVTSASPIRRTRPKVAVVTKINDFNPLLVRKLGAVCSCQSPVLVLKGRRPTTQIDESELEEVERQSTRVLPNLPVNTVTATPVVTSTFNPIIVPENSFYEDYQDSESIKVEVTSGRNALVQNIPSSTPVYIPTDRVLPIQSRTKTVTTAAPTYETVLLNREVTQAHRSSADADSQSFNRYGPGGWRGKDETLQGSVDCQRAGLFRHPKHCNKFYSCRWDCTKQRFTLHVFNCPIQLSFDTNIGACNWPSQGPSCQGNTLLTNTL